MDKGHKTTSKVDATKSDEEEKKRILGQCKKRLGGVQGGWGGENIHIYVGKTHRVDNSLSSKERIILFV